MRLCPRCKKRERLPGGYCAECKREYAREYYVRNVEKNREKINERVRRARTPEKTKASHLWNLYRLRPEEYAELLKDGCGVCGSFDDLHVDHDHNCCKGKRSCGKCVRGVLCKAHNLALGWFQDNVTDLQRAIAYLERKW